MLTPKWDDAAPRPAWRPSAHEAHAAIAAPRYGPVTGASAPRRPGRLGPSGAPPRETASRSQLRRIWLPPLPLLLLATTRGVKARALLAQFQTPLEDQVLKVLVALHLQGLAVSLEQMGRRQG